MPTTEALTKDTNYMTWNKSPDTTDVDHCDIGEGLSERRMSIFNWVLWVQTVPDHFVSLGSGRSDRELEFPNLMLPMGLERCSVRMQDWLATRELSGRSSLELCPGHAQPSHDVPDPPICCRLWVAVFGLALEALANGGGRQRRYEQGVIDHE